MCNTRIANEYYTYKHTCHNLFYWYVVFKSVHVVCRVTQTQRHTRIRHGTTPTQKYFMYIITPTQNVLVVFKQ